ncbi:MULTISPECIES: hypothetical protein [Brevibacterium]|uniref:Uncharacterized protein n=1 Tax=Brevibacterium antiquum CNRZ 918 TaxID=1255637 RepID=A0A2H1KEA4_9MICO|nr:MULTISPECIES: hypothetical protein [Brevibacterium]SMX97874.1 hypothetical protein BANT918_02367 [Brevibacterium antiquum CNRZ 918]
MTNSLGFANTVAYYEPINEIPAKDTDAVKRMAESTEDRETILAMLGITP